MYMYNYYCNSLPHVVEEEEEEEEEEEVFIQP